MDKKKKKNYFGILIGISFIVFLVLYFAQLNGYYDYTNYNKMQITKEAMEQFEKDVSEGKNIEIEDYLEFTYTDYSNGMSNLGIKTGTFIEKLMVDGIGETIKIFKILFT